MPKFIADSPRTPEGLPPLVLFIKPPECHDSHPWLVFREQGTDEEVGVAKFTDKGMELLNLTDRERDLLTKYDIPHKLVRGSYYLTVPFES